MKTPLKLVIGALFLALFAFVGVTTLVPKTQLQQAFGAVTSPDMPFFYLHWGAGNGVQVFPTGRKLATATTTPCSIQSPSATSTLQSAGLKLDVASTSATTWSLYNSATPYLTTTAINTGYVVSASAQGFIQASTSPAALAATVFAPNTYAVWSETGGITGGDTLGTGFVPSGACQATFENYPTVS